MESTFRYAWPLRLAFLGTIALFLLAPWVGVMLFTVIVVPVGFHYMIRRSQATAKSPNHRGYREPIHDLALIFGTTPMVWLALAFDAGLYGHETQLIMVALWLWFQFPLASIVLFLGRKKLFPAPRDVIKLGFFLVPWVLMVLSIALVRKKEAWREAFLEPQVQMGLFLIGFVSIVCLYLMFRIFLKSKEGDTIVPPKNSKTIGPLRLTLARFFVLGFGFFPFVWALLFIAYCLHWTWASGGRTIAIGPPNQSFFLAFHHNLVEFLAVTMAFCFPAGATLAWFISRYLLVPTGNSQLWARLWGWFLPGWVLLLVIGEIDPGGWFGRVFRPEILGVLPTEIQMEELPISPNAIPEPNPEIFPKYQ